MRELLWATMIAIAVRGDAAAQTRDPTTRGTSWLGCYTLRFTASRAAVLFADAPTFVQLDTVPTRRGYLVRPGPGRSDRKWRRILGDTISWRPVNADSLEIVAVYGFWADVLGLKRIDDSVAGTLKVHPDGIDSAQLKRPGAGIYGKRVPCRGPSRVLPNER